MTDVFVFFGELNDLPPMCGRIGRVDTKHSHEYSTSMNPFDKADITEGITEDVMKLDEQGGHQLIHNRFRHKRYIWNSPAIVGSAAAAPLFERLYRTE